MRWSSRYENRALLRGITWLSRRIDRALGLKARTFDVDLDSCPDSLDGPVRRRFLHRVSRPSVTLHYLRRFADVRVLALTPLLLVCAWYIVKFVLLFLYGLLLG